MNDAKIKVIDLFCGAGGVTSGIENAMLAGSKCAEVVACVNHDPIAIISHEANHAHCKHFTEDIKVLDVHLLPSKKDFDADNIVILWASLECTNFSKAKGGKARDQDSRTLADHLYRYIDHINPDYILIENVREFMSWGPLDENGKPINKKNGKDYMKWMYTICDRGYNYDFRLLNAADYGAHTSRIRYFGCFAKKGFPIIYPETTHDKFERHGLKKWRAVKEVLDFDLEGESIFTRKKPLSEKTLQRIYAGLVKYVGNGAERFITHFHGGDPFTKVWSVERPTRTISAMESQQLVKPCFLVNYHHSSDVNSIAESCPTLTTKDKLAFISAYYGNGDNVSGVDVPSPTISTKDRLALVESQFWIDKQYGFGKDQQTIDQPAGTVVVNDKHRLVEAEKWHMNTNYGNVGSDLESPAPVITANRKHSYLINPQWGKDANSSIDQPAFTLIARMDKTPPYLVSTEEGYLAIQVFEDDLEIMVKIKYFMAAHGIIDIKMRMLIEKELLMITGFVKEYFDVVRKVFPKLTQTAVKKYIGNAVPPVVPQRWIEALTAALIERQIISHAA